MLIYLFNFEVGLGQNKANKQFCAVTTFMRIAGCSQENMLQNKWFN